MFFLERVQKNVKYIRENVKILKKKAKNGSIEGKKYRKLYAWMVFLLVSFVKAWRWVQYNQ